jgi:hypothetical protein
MASGTEPLTPVREASALGKTSALPQKLLWGFVADLVVGAVCFPITLGGFVLLNRMSTPASVVLLGLAFLCLLAAPEVAYLRLKHAVSRWREQAGHLYDGADIISRASRFVIGSYCLIALLVILAACLANKNLANIQIGM